MSLKRGARAFAALAAAYAIVLQAALMVIGGPSGQPTDFIGQAHLCVTPSGGQPAPGGDNRDCGGTCLAGCCFAGPGGPSLVPVVSVPASWPVVFADFAAAPLPYVRGARAHRSRAPPVA